MSALRNQKNSVLFALGIVFVLCAASYFYIEQRAGFLSIIFALLGAILLLLSLINKGKSERKSVSVFEWSRAAAFALTISLSIVFLLGVNYFSHRLPYRWDVTQYQQHTLTQATVDFVKGIDAFSTSAEALPASAKAVSASAKGSIEMTAFYVGLPPKYLQDLLNEYERISNGKISVNIVDPIEDIAYAAKFGNVISGEERKLIVVSGDERKDIDFSNASLSEEQITNALARISRAPRTAYFLTGHGELSESNQSNQGLSLFANLLNSNNISSKSLMLGTELKIPEDCDVLIIAGPRTDLTDHEELLVKDYLKRGGDALFLIEAVTVTSPEKELTAEQIDKNPSLNSILNQWGINIGNDIVVDLASHVGGDQGSPATKNYGDHKAITVGLDYTFYVRPRSISLLNDRRESIQLAPIALSASKDRSWAETDRTLNVRYDKGVDIAGPVAISYVIWEGKEADEESDTRIIVFTDADFLSNAYLNQYSNAAMGINIVNWLAELDYTVFNNQKNIKVERLDLTSKQRRTVTALLFLMPLLIGLVGLFVWMRS